MPELLWQRSLDFLENLRRGEVANPSLLFKLEGDEGGILTLLANRMDTLPTIDAKVRPIKYVNSVRG